MKFSISVNRREVISKLPKTAIHVILIIASVIALFPVYVMISNALKSGDEYRVNVFGLPSRLYLENFRYLFVERNFVRLFLNSTILTIVSVLLSTWVASLAAFAFARLRFRGRKLLYTLTISLMSVPVIVTLIPLFVLMTKLGLVNTYPAAIIIYAGLVMPFSIYLLSNFFLSIPEELLDAALIDGCSTFQMFQKIILPLSYPALTTLAIANAIWVWNDLLIALVFLQKDSLRTLTVGVMFFRSKFVVEPTLIFTGMTIITIPMIIAYLLGQRYFIRGLVEGAFK